MALWCKCDQVLKAITDLRLDLIDKMNRNTSDNDKETCDFFNPQNLICFLVVLGGFIYTIAHIMITIRGHAKKIHVQVSKRIKKKNVTLGPNPQASDDELKETKMSFLDSGLVIIKEEPMDQESASADEGAGNLDLAEQNNNIRDAEQNNTNASPLDVFSNMNLTLMDECNISTATTSTIAASDTTATTSSLQGSSSQVQWYIFGVNLNKTSVSSLPTQRPKRRLRIDQQAKATDNSEATEATEKPKE